VASHAAIRRKPAIEDVVSSFATETSYRVALLSLVAFFAAGLLLLARVDVRRAIAEANVP